MAATPVDPSSKRPAKFQSVDAYIASFPTDVQAVLQEVRQALHAAVPGADETISYDIPTLTLDGRAVVYFAGWKEHVSVYPLPEGDREFDEAVAPYRSGAATAKFPLSRPVPLELVQRAGHLLAERAAHAT
jgi:uncharacterized protein YdhG (YjbR/CyaY superfamily)